MRITKITGLHCLQHNSNRSDKQSAEFKMLMHHICLKYVSFNYTFQLHLKLPFCSHLNHQNLHQWNNFKISWKWWKSRKQYSENGWKSFFWKRHKEIYTKTLERGTKLFKTKPLIFSGVFFLLSTCLTLHGSFKQHIKN